jgi:hypothetical protein
VGKGEQESFQKQRVHLSSIKLGIALSSGFCSRFTTER